MELYNKEMIEVLLEEYKYLNELDEHILDFEEALKATIFDEKERLFVFLSFACELNLIQVMKLSNFSFSEMEEIKDSLLEKLEAILNGYTCEKVEYEESNAFNLKSMMLEVQTKHIDLYELNREVRMSLIQWLAENNDDLALCALNMKKDEREYKEDVSKESYNFYEVPDKFWWKNASNDGLYRQDISNNVTFYGDFWGDLDEI